MRNYSQTQFVLNWGKSYFKHDSYLPLPANYEFLELVSAQSDVLLGLILVRQPFVAKALGSRQPLPANKNKVKKTANLN